MDTFQLITFDLQYDFPMGLIDETFYFPLCEYMYFYLQNSSLLMNTQRRFAKLSSLSPARVGNNQGYTVSSISQANHSGFFAQFLLFFGGWALTRAYLAVSSILSRCC